MKTRYISVATIIVNYKVPQLVISCLDHLLRNLPKYSHCKVYVVDNNSEDNSVEQIREVIHSKGWSCHVSLIALDQNVGFGRANNLVVKQLAAKAISPDYFYFLNPDAMMQSGALAALIDLAEELPKLGIVGSQLENEEGVRQCSAHNSLTPLGELWSTGVRLGWLTKLLIKFLVSPACPTESGCYDWVSAASCLIRRKTYEDVRGFDETFFLYYEDVDLCLRVRKEGWLVACEPKSRVLHLESSATKLSHSGSRSPSYWYASRRRYYVKHFGVWGLISADVMRVIGILIARFQEILHIRNVAVRPPPQCAITDLLIGDWKALWTEVNNHG